MSQKLNLTNLNPVNETADLLLLALTNEEFAAIFAACNYLLEDYERIQREPVFLKSSAENQILVRKAQKSIIRALSTLIRTKKQILKEL